MSANRDAAKLPGQIKYIIGNEGCERFSFYGMRNILVQFLITSTLLQHILENAERELVAKDIMHTFMIGVYFFPLLGGWLSDRFFGKFKTIMWFSLIYCAGHACLALFEDNRAGFFTGLALIALGAGGIKPLVATFVGDQFTKANEHLAKVVFDAFYWIINFGSLFASLLMPLFLKQYGPSVAFGIPGLLMFIATVVLWLGRKQYVMVPPAPNTDPDTFGKIIKTALFRKVDGKSSMGLYLAGLSVVGSVAILAWVAMQLAQGSVAGVVIALCLIIVLLIGGVGGGAYMQLDRARGIHSDVSIEGARNVLRLLVAFALTTPFYSLFDQKASTWVIQGKDMLKPEWFSAAQMQALNPALVMILIPFNNMVLFPFLRKRGYNVNALGRMTWGIAFSGLSWIVIGLIQLQMDGGNPMSIVWQVLPYALLTFGEVLVSATGLEFAYSQAPASMKGVVMSFWNLTTTIGNLWVLIMNQMVRNDSVTATIEQTGMSSIAFQMFFFAGFALVAALAFGWYAKRYQVVNNYREASL